MKRIGRFLAQLYFHPNFFIWGAMVVLLSFLSFYFPILSPISKIALGIWILLSIVDIILLFRQNNSLFASRDLSKKLSNGDQNPIYLFIENRYPFNVHLSIIDEIPDQFQRRDLEFRLKLNAGESKNLVYNLRPVKRGKYLFGCINILAQSPLRLIRRRYRLGEEQETAVYPSFIQMRKYELHAISQKLTLYGIKKLRKVGHNNEFEKIKEYVVGDDIRTINWKASAKRNQLMVNQYIEERAQPIYSMIDMGRTMKMPFHEMTLLDYSINASLVLSNIALQKFDQAGLVCFSNEINEFIPADRRGGQLSKILEALYKQKTRWPESNFEQLHILTKHKINRRSLFMIYTHFETVESMRRQLPYLRSISRNHVVVIIFFYNTEIKDLLDKNASNTEEIYLKTIAQKMDYEKRQIVLELRQHGVYSVLTTPEALTIDVINKYLEIKSSGLL